MTLPVNRPFKDIQLSESCTSIATTPVAAFFIAPTTGYIQRVLASAGGTTTGTIAVSVVVNAGSDITGGGLTIAAGTGARNNPAYTFPLTGANAVHVIEGDFITFTPSGGTGSSIPGAFAVVIREG